MGDDQERNGGEEERRVGVREERGGRYKQF